MKIEENYPLTPTMLKSVLDFVEKQDIKCFNISTDFEENPLDAHDWVKIHLHFRQQIGMHTVHSKTFIAMVSTEEY